MEVQGLPLHSSPPTSFSSSLCNQFRPQHAHGRGLGHTPQIVRRPTFFFFFGQRCTTCWATWGHRAGHDIAVAALYGTWTWCNLIIWTKWPRQGHRNTYRAHNRFLMLRRHRTVRSSFHVCCTLCACFGRIGCIHSPYERKQPNCERDEHCGVESVSL